MSVVPDIETIETRLSLPSPAIKHSDNRYLWKLTSEHLLVAYSAVDDADAAEVVWHFFVAGPSNGRRSTTHTIKREDLRSDPSLNILANVLHDIIRKANDEAERQDLQTKVDKTESYEYAVLVQLKTQTDLLYEIRNVLEKLGPLSKKK